jgi:hypothetical protein
MNLSIQYNNKIDSKKEIESLIYKAYNLNKDFFEKDLDSLVIKLFYNREDFDIYFEKIYNQKSEKWIVAWIPSSSLINIFSPSVFESQTSHSKDNFIKVLTHEISHVFIKEIYKINRPRWLIEGLADYISGKNLNNILLKEIIEFKELHNFKDFHKHNAYNQSGLFVKYLLDTFGKNKLFNLLINIKTNDNKFNGFCETFENTYKSNFQEVVKDWCNIV